MRLHRNVALGILLGLENVLIKKRSASEVLKKLLRSNRSWGGKDRRTIGKIFYDIIRQKLFFEALTSTTENNHWPLLGCWMVLNEHQLPDWEEFENMNPTSLLAKAAVLSQQRRYRYSIPEWMDKMGVESMGEALWEKEMASLNTPAELVIRVNTLKLTVPKLKSILEKKYKIVSHRIPDYPDALLIEKKQPLHQLAEYRNGYFEVQDANSQKIVPWLNPEANQLYVDTCAGAGGKSLHLATLTGDAAKIIAVDIEPLKLQELIKRCKRNNIKSVEVIRADKTEKLNTLIRAAQGVLIDAPCSGMGVLKRNPDTKWNITPEKLDELIALQHHILKTYAPMVKKGGSLIYATCSILPAENQHQLAHFLESKLGKSFAMDNEHTYYSHQTGFDGFYCARLTRVM